MIDIEEEPEFRCGAEWVSPDGAILTVHGELDIATARTVRDELDYLKDKGVQRLAIDLSDCSFLDSGGLAVFIAAQRLINSPLHVVAASGLVQRVLHITGLDDVFILHASRGEAMRALQTHLKVA